MKSDGTSKSDGEWTKTGLVVGALVLVVLQIGDRLLDAAGVTADEAVDERGGLVEVLGTRQQIRVLPDGVAGVGADGFGQSFPQRRSLAQLARPQLQPDKGGERLLG